MQDIIRILKVGKSLRRSYIAISIFTILLSFLTILSPLITGWAVDEIQKGVDASILVAVILALAIFLLDLAQNLFSNISGYIGDQVAVKLNHILSRNYFKHLMTLPQYYFDNQQTGKIVSRLNRSIVQITNFIQMMSNNFLQFIFSTVLSLAIVYWISVEVGVLLTLLYPIFIFMTVRTSNTWQKYQDEKNENFDIANGRFNEAVTQVKVVKSFSQQVRELNFFSKHLKNVEELTKPQSSFWHREDVKRRIVLNIIFFLVYLFIFVRGAQGQLSTGEAVTLILYALNIRIPIFTISYLVESTQRAISDSREYFKAMEEEPEQDGSSEILSNVEGTITYEDVVFAYDGGKDVVKGVSFEIKDGEKVAFVGESGEGKTTLTNLLLRLYDPKSGGITIDDIDISTVSRKSVRENISVVFQEPNLFSGTIRENISYGSPKATEIQIMNAAKAANAHEFINELDNTYDTEIGERGLKLSGGQKQRIAIARALLKDAPILVLDEATSSLDSKSELLVHEALENLMKDRTTIIIAHRLSTIQSVDKIVALKNGKVSEVGSPQKLAKSNGIYSKLLDVQTARSKEARQKALGKFGIVG